MRFAKQVQSSSQSWNAKDSGSRRTKSGWIIYPPDKSKATIGTHRTPSDHKAWINFQADLKRAGFITPK